MLINWSSREIDVFLVLAETLSFRRTAERVHLSQPAVTAVIGRLEEALGVRLFERSARGVEMTPAGQQYLQRVASALGAINAATEEDWTTEYLAPVLAIKIVRDLDEAAVLADIRARDDRDMNRATAPLKRAADAVLLDTTSLDISSAIRAAIDIVEAVRAGRRSA